MKKTFKVVMLPSEKASDLICLTMRVQKSLHYKKDMNNDFHNADDAKYNHLYIISDDEIKEGDWMISHSCVVCKAVNSTLVNMIPVTGTKCKKIVATTDILHGKFLQYAGKRYRVPQLNEQFIQAYIKAYNEGKPITEVDLEVIQDKLYIKPEDMAQYNSKPKELQHPHTSNPDDIWTIKTRPDNTVIIHQSKMYSRDEVVKLFEKYLEDSNNPKWSKYSGFDKWIQDNL